MTRSKDPCACGRRKHHSAHNVNSDQYEHDYSSTAPRFGDKPRDPLNPRSEALAVFYADVYQPAVAEAIGNGRKYCEMKAPGCTGFVEGLHEIETRARAGGVRQAYRSDNVIPACHWCNRWASEHPIEATKRGWLAHASPVGSEAVA